MHEFSDLEDGKALTSGTHSCFPDYRTFALGRRLWVSPGISICCLSRVLTAFIKGGDGEDACSERKHQFNILIPKLASFTMNLMSLVIVVYVRMLVRLPRLHANHLS
jgi:hypothetical protein